MRITVIDFEEIIRSMEYLFTLDLGELSVLFDPDFRERGSEK